MQVLPRATGQCAERGLESCPRICIGGMKGSRPVVTAEEIGVFRGVDNADHPIIRLSLRKPRHWNWKLTTSASSPAVILPVVCLVDDNGNVLHDETTDVDSNINIPVKCAVRNSATRCRGHSRPSSVERSKTTLLDWRESSERTASEVSSDWNEKSRSHGKTFAMYGQERQDERGRHSDRKRYIILGQDGDRSYREQKFRDMSAEGGNSSYIDERRYDMLVQKGSGSFTERIKHGMSRNGRQDSSGSHSDRKRPEGNNGSYLDRKRPEGNNGSYLDRKRPEGNSSSHMEKKRPEGNNGSHTDRRRPEGNNGSYSDRKRPEGNSDSHTDRKIPEGNNGSYLDRKRPEGNSSSHMDRKIPEGNNGSHTDRRRPEGNNGSHTDRRRPEGNNGSHTNRRRPEGNSDSHTDHREKRRHRRQPDSGYMSLRRGKDSSDGDHEAPRRRRASEASQDSSSASEQRAESTRRRKRIHRKAFIVGDCLLAISGQQARLYKQPDALTSRRHDESTASRRPRRRQRRQSPLSTMGSNVSRHSDKGLSGRRTQSSGNLCNGNKILGRDVGRILTSCSQVGEKDRNRFCGSLPNYLDGEYAGNELDEQCCNNNNNNDASSSSSMKARLEEQKNGLELRLMPHHDMALQDQGYASERSPEDEHPPPLPDMPERDSYAWLTQQYPFITPEASFDVALVKTNRGLGLSVTGGVDTTEQWPGLIRIKRLFPHQPAWQCGHLAVGDILLAANGVSLTGLTNYQALEVLRTTPNNVELVLCRPPSNVFCVTVPSEPPLPPRRDPSHSISVSHAVVPLPLLQIEEPYGEFDILLKKVNRSLGFTLRKEDESILGHYVRALVREPALSDGRIRPGDKIVAVNDVPLSPMSHEEAVTFLRQCGETVKLRLYRDAAQTPIAALSPTDMDQGGLSRPRPMLRQEARDMLTDLAVRKLSPSNSSGSSHGLLQCLSGASSPGTSPRRRRLTKTASPDMHTIAQDKYGQRYLAASQIEDSNNSDENSWNNMFTIANAESAQVVDLSDVGEESLEIDASRPQRPRSLNLSNNADSPRRQKYTFSGIDRKRDDASGSPTMTSDSMIMTRDDLSQGYPISSTSEDNGGPLMEPVSLPPLSSTSSTSTAFSYRNPAYQSAHPSCNGPRKSVDDEAMTECLSEQDISGKVFEGQADGTCSLIKWKGVVFTPQNGAKKVENDSLPSEIDTENEQVLIVELNRGWNSRLGFSLQADGYRTFISAIYEDSVAAKDGRLRPQDQLLTVNDENVENMTTTEIIDLLRKIRGTIEIRVLRKCGPNLS